MGSAGLIPAPMLQILVIAGPRFDFLDISKACMIGGHVRSLASTLVHLNRPRGRSLVDSVVVDGSSRGFVFAPYSTAVS
jgi:hypothetical protein